MKNDTAKVVNDPRGGRPSHRPLDAHRSPQQQAAMWEAEKARLDTVTPILTPEAQAAAWEAAQLIETSLPTFRRKGKDILSDVSVLLARMANTYRPPLPDEADNPHADRELFDRYLGLLMKTAALKAPYESPKAVVIKDERSSPSHQYDFSRLSDEQLLALRQLLIAAKPAMMIEASPKSPNDG
jgi:hypothetical protein